MVLVMDVRPICVSRLLALRVEAGAVFAAIAFTTTQGCCGRMRFMVFCFHVQRAQMCRLCRVLQALLIANCTRRFTMRILVLKVDMQRIRVRELHGLRLCKLGAACLVERSIVSIAVVCSVV